MLLLRKSLGLFAIDRFLVFGRPKLTTTLCFTLSLSSPHQGTAA
jgi:hypothetical protein